MAGLVPAIHVFPSEMPLGQKDVDARHKAEHDDFKLVPANTRQRHTT
jgi:hypothetical protein